MPTLTTMSGYGFEPQSTSEPDQPATSSTSNTSPNISSNPSLILAFLALSFFTMAMVFIFGFRRYQYFHERLHEVFGRADLNRPSEQRAAGEIGHRRVPGKRPKLWDVCTDSSVLWCEVKSRGIAGKKAAGGEAEALWKWDNVFPLAATKVATADELGTVPFRSLRRPNPANLNIFQRFWRFGTTPPRSGDKGLKHIKPSSTHSPISRLRLAMLVAMPSERYPIYDRKLREDTSRHERGTFGYELGLYEVPWNDDVDVT